VSWMIACLAAWERSFCSHLRFSAIHAPPFPHPPSRQKHPPNLWLAVALGAVAWEIRGRVIKWGKILELRRCSNAWRWSMYQRLLREQPREVSPQVLSILREMARECRALGERTPPNPFDPVRR
jgi:hypothetical protein